MSQLFWAVIKLGSQYYNSMEQTSIFSFFPRQAPFSFRGIEARFSPTLRPDLGHTLAPIKSVPNF